MKYLGHSFVIFKLKLSSLCLYLPHQALKLPILSLTCSFILEKLIYSQCFFPSLKNEMIKLGHLKDPF